MNEESKNTKIIGLIILTASAAFLLAIFCIMGNRSSMVSLYGAGGTGSSYRTGTSDNSTASSVGSFSQKEFTIEGKWQNVGSMSGWMVDRGSVIVFDGSYCSIYSPMDTYTFAKNGNQYLLTVSGMIGGVITFDVTIQDNDHITLADDGIVFELQRVE